MSLTKAYNYHKTRETQWGLRLNADGVSGSIDEYNESGGGPIVEFTQVVDCDCKKSSHSDLLSAYNRIMCGVRVLIGHMGAEYSKYQSQEDA